MGVAVLVLAGLGGSVFLQLSGGGTDPGPVVPVAAPATSAPTPSTPFTSTPFTSTPPQASGPGKAELQTVAERYVAAANQRDATTAKTLTCDGRTGVLYDALEGKRATFVVSTVDDPSGSFASVGIRVGGGAAADIPLLFEARPDGTGWCVFV